MDHQKHSRDLPSLPKHVLRIAKIKRSCANVIYTSFWGWEYAAVLVSAVATITLILLLKSADQQQKRSWTIGNTQLTLNALIAIISSMIRASLVVLLSGSLTQSPWNWFADQNNNDRQGYGRPLKDLDLFGDAASNTWASLKLLYRTKFRYLAPWGALLLVLSLGFDAFVQQLLATERREVQNVGPGPNLSGSTIPRMTSYINVIDPSVGGSGTWSDHGPVPRLDAQAAVMSSIMGTSKRMPIATCSTANCTWPVTPSNGVCGSCEDVRDQATFTTDNSTTTGMAYTLSTGGTNPPNISVTFDSDSLFALVSMQPSGNTSGFVSGRQSVVSIKALGIPASSFGAASSLKSRPNRTWAESLVVAYSCSLYFCLQAYNASSTKGIFTPQLLETWDQMDVNVPANFTSSSWASGDPQPNWTFAQIPASMNVDQALSGPVLDFESRTALGTPLLMGLRASVGINVTSGAPTVGQFDFTPPILAMWMAANSTDTMSQKVQGVADSLTSYMRTDLAAPPTERYAPTTYSEAVFVAVRWPWLTYPLILVVASYAFFAATVLQTRRRAVKPWKSQRLPLLLANVDDIVREFAAGGLHRRDGLEERIGRIRVRIEFDGQDSVTFKRALEEKKSSEAE